MHNKQGSHLLTFCNAYSSLCWLCCILALLLQTNLSFALSTNLEAIDVVTLAGNKLQIQMRMNAPIEEPQVFQTDNPARIALDFANISNALGKKMVNVDQGAVSSIYLMAAGDRLRVVVNLLESVPYQTEVSGNLVLLTLSAKTARNSSMPVSRAPSAPVNNGQNAISRYLPQQGIANVDFRRGDKGEGRIILNLANPNTVINAKEVAGKIEVEFLNTVLPAGLAKNLDVTDFATPVKAVALQMRGPNTVVAVTPVNSNYEYSSLQADGNFIIEFRPLTPEEKVAQEKEKFAYVGEKLSLNFQDIEIRSVLQILADFTKLNVVAADNVQGKVTLQMNDVPWDQALDLILKSKGLSKRTNGSVILVAPTAEINKIEKDELDAKNVVEQLEPLKTEYIQINYAKAENFRLLISGMSTGGVDGCAISKAQMNMLNSSSGGGGAGAASMSGAMPGGAGMPGMGGMGGGSSAGGGGANGQDIYRLLSQRGTAVVDGRTNTLIIKDTSDKIVEIRKLIELLDKPVRQVMIESRIVLASNNLAKELGVRFGAAKAANVGGGQSFAMGGNATKGNVDGSLNVKDSLIDLGATGTAIASGFPPAALGMTLARGADYVLNLELSALQNAGEAEILSNPRVMTSDRCKAVITQGQQIPYQTFTVINGLTTPSVTFQQAILQLEVIPQITPSGSVIMNLSIKKDEALDANANPRINNREINTTVTVSDGETVVLGGVFENDLNKSEDSIPFLSDLPGVGSLFKHKINTDKKRELLIFVTPKIAVEGIAIQ